jgi:hypothetical protein
MLRIAAAAIKALELDSTLGEAHNSLAFVLDGLGWDFDSFCSVPDTCTLYPADSGALRLWEAPKRSLPSAILRKACARTRSTAMAGRSPSWRSWLAFRASDISRLANWNQ